MRWRNSVGVPPRANTKWANRLIPECDTIQPDRATCAGVQRVRQPVQPLERRLFGMGVC